MSFVYLIALFDCLIRICQSRPLRHSFLKLDVIIMIIDWIRSDELYLISYEVDPDSLVQLCLSELRGYDVFA